MPKDHSIEIDDTDDNWHNWGRLVVKWIEQPGTRPTTAKQLKKQWDNWQPPITGKIRGLAQDIAVEITTYDGDGPIIIPIPTKKMLKKDWDHLQAEFAAGNKKYPVPKFYDLLYQTATRKDFATYQDLEDEAVRRLGEYVINECM